MQLIAVIWKDATQKHPDFTKTSTRQSERELTDYCIKLAGAGGRYIIAEVLVDMLVYEGPMTNLDRNERSPIEVDDE